MDRSPYTAQDFASQTQTGRRSTCNRTIGDAKEAARVKGFYVDEFPLANVRSYADVPYIPTGETVAQTLRRVGRLVGRDLLSGFHTDLKQACFDGPRDDDGLTPKELSLFIEGVDTARPIWANHLNLVEQTRSVAWS